WVCDLPPLHQHSQRLKSRLCSRAADLRRPFSLLHVISPSRSFVSFDFPCTLFVRGGEWNGKAGPGFWCQASQLAIGNFFFWRGNLSSVRSNIPHPDLRRPEHTAEISELPERNARQLPAEDRQLRLHPPRR